MMTSPHEGLKRKGWDISGEDLYLKKGNALHARSLLFMNIFCSMPGVLMILRNIQISTAMTNLSPICKLT
jgi:hypothetical protein